MLGALFSFILLCLFYYWWHLLQVFRHFRKGKDIMSYTQFWIFLVLNFGVISAITLSIYSFIPVHTKEYEWLWPYTDVLPIALQIIPLIVSCLIYRLYQQAKKHNKDIVTKKESIDL